MANLENVAGRAIHNIDDRLTKAQIVRDSVGKPVSAEERLLRAITGAETPIARSEAVIEPQIAGELLTRATSIRNWLIDHAPTYEEEPSSRVDDETGWAYNQGGFEISADNTTKPSSLSTAYLLSITEGSPHYPSAEVWFSVVEDNQYNLSIRFFKTPERVQGQVRHEYTSFDKTFGEMPEDDGVIVEDLLTRVSTHLAQEV